MRRLATDGCEAAGGDAGILTSPSLFLAGAGGPPAFELKFRLDPATAAAVASDLAGVLAPDPHGDPARGGAYRTTTVYADTADFAVLLRAKGHRRRKYRARRYGDAGPVFLERKEKAGDRVRKTRSPDGPDADWFREETAARGLRPACRVTYDRLALTGVVAGEVVRVTFDRMLRGTRAADWTPEPVDAGPDALGGAVVCEFKFRDAMPGLLKGVVARRGLAPGGASKYRLVMGAGHV